MYIPVILPGAGRALRPRLPEVVTASELFRGVTHGKEEEEGQEEGRQEEGQEVILSRAASDRGSRAGLA